MFAERKKEKKKEEKKKEKKKKNKTCVVHQCYSAWKEKQRKNHESCNQSNPFFQLLPGLISR